MAAVAGICYASVYPQVEVYMGSWLGTKSFIAAVLGGIGDIRGAMLGGFIMGISEIFRHRGELHVRLRGWLSSF